MTTPRHGRQYHPFYSSHADPNENMLRAHTLKSKSSYNISQQWPAVQGPGAPVHGQQNKFGSRSGHFFVFILNLKHTLRWTLAQPETAGQLRQEKQDRKNNTYYNNMIMYINNKQGDNDSTVSGIKVSAEEVIRY